MTIRTFVVAATAAAISMMAAPTQAVTFSEMMGPDMGSTAVYQTKNFDNPPSWLDMTGTVGTYNGHNLVLDQSTAIFVWNIGGFDAISFHSFGAGLVTLLDSQLDTMYQAYVGDDTGVGDRVFLTRDPGDSQFFGAMFQADDLFGKWTLTNFSAGPEVTGGAVPEPASWALMIAGFGMTGAMLRRRRNYVTV